MFNMRQQLVNVSRIELIEALKAGLAAHKVEYVEAKKDYAVAVVKFLEEALHRAECGDHSDLVLRLPKPENHERDYTNAIEMLEQSVDDSIQLDSESFRAYFKGEWSWKRSFAESAVALKGYLGGAIA